MASFRTEAASPARDAFGQGNVRTTRTWRAHGTHSSNGLHIRFSVWQSATKPAP